MGKIFIFCTVFLLVISCKQKESGKDNAQTEEQVFSLNNLPKKAAINPQAKEILRDWVEFNALEASFNGLYNVKDKAELSLVIEDLIEKQKLLEASKFPEEFDVPQIKSRLKVIKTTILKTKFTLEYREDPKAPATALAKAYNAFRNQFTVIVNSRLDTTIVKYE